MAVIRFDPATHDAMRKHAPSIHSYENGNPIILPLFERLHLAKGQLQHDGTFILHAGGGMIARLRQNGFHPEIVHKSVLQFHEIHQELSRKVGVWSTWMAVGGNVHDWRREPSEGVQKLHRHFEGDEHHDALAAIRDKFAHGAVSGDVALSTIAVLFKHLHEAYMSGKVDALSLLNGLAALQGTSFPAATSQNVRK